MSGDHPDDSESAPKIFITALFFDKNYNLVDAAWNQVSTAGAQTDAQVKQPPHDLITITAQAQESGFVYIFLSNEHYNFVDAYFDDVTFSITPSQIVSIADYYPYGLTFNYAEREGYQNQRYFFNGMERQNDFDLNLLNTFYRTYDATSARWLAVDPKPAEMLSPYSSMAGNPILYTDPMGDTTVIVSTSGEYITTIPDRLPNQLHFIDAKKFVSMKQGKGESVDKYADRVRQQSTAFVGSNTVNDMRAIVKQANAARNGESLEIGFVGLIGADREIRLVNLGIQKENNKDAEVNIGDQIIDKFGYKGQGSILLFGHVHHKHLSPASKWEIPTVFEANVLHGASAKDYLHKLRDNNGSVRESPGVIATSRGFSVYKSLHLIQNSLAPRMDCHIILLNILFLV